MAEPAGERAADLGGDAQRAAILLRDVDGLDLLAVGHLQQPFGRTVEAVLAAGLLRPLDDVAGLQLGAEPLAEIRHPGEVRRAGRSEESRVGKECVSTCRSRWSP